MYNIVCYEFNVLTFFVVLEIIESVNCFQMMDRFFRLIYAVKGGIEHSLCVYGKKEKEKRMKKIVAIMTACVLALSMAACGSKNPDQNASSEAPSAAVSESSGAEASAASGEAGGLDTIKANGKLVMLTNATFPPFEYIGDDGSVAGVDPDVAAEIAKDLGVELEILDMNFDLLIEAVKSGKGDFAAAGMTITPERQEQVDFSKEYVKSAQYLIVQKGSSITKDTLDGTTIAVQESTTGDFYASDEVQAKEVMRFKGATETGAALIAGKCDAVILDKLPAEAIVANSNGKLELLPDPLTEESYAFAVKKGNAELLDAINATLQRLMDEGKIDELVTEHANAA
ncbi:MAG: amino acid ABC transporter substrate-binding protein [Ruminococcaceae bacterium]|nr:amino acid ABC transporter substrate-binding protein [Oscillospiraceae bacterium]